jgi:hypothetical protein
MEKDRIVQVDGDSTGHALVDGKDLAEKRGERSDGWLLTALATESVSRQAQE